MAAGVCVSSMSRTACGIASIASAGVSTPAQVRLSVSNVLAWSETNIESTMRPWPGT